jgi:DNA-binding transcriptional regulator YiaG
MATGSADLEALVAKITAAKLPPPARRRRIREAAGVPLHEAAAVIDVSTMTLLRWERGLCEPRTREDRARYRELLDRLAEAVK